MFRDTKNEKIDHDTQIRIYIDVNVGMNRTGADPDELSKFYQALEKSPNFEFGGLHVYDGHIRTEDLDKRTQICNQGFDRIREFLSQIEEDVDIICGGSVTFPIHAQDTIRTLSPGTTLLWDYRYGSSFPDIPMQNAATVVSRIISKPSTDRICLDLGHKSVASEMSDRRVNFPQIGEYERVGHSEEHLVLKVAKQDDWNVGDVLYGIPTHICPTVALHKSAIVVEENKIVDNWEVSARHRLYTL